MATGKGNGDEEMYAGVFLQFSCWMFACQVFMQVPGPFCWTWIVSKTKLGVWVQKIKHTRPQINWQFLVLRTQHCDSLMHFQDFQGETNYKNMFRPWRSTNFVGIAWNCVISHLNKLLEVGRRCHLVFAQREAGWRSHGDGGGWMWGRGNLNMEPKN